MILQNVIKEGSTCAIYAHVQDISDIIHYVRRYSKNRVKVDKKTYLSVIKQKRTFSGFFVLFNKNKIKFYEPIEVPKSKNVFVWRGGESYGR